jgi:hypothetical protein
MSIGTSAEATADIFRVLPRGKTEQRPKRVRVRTVNIKHLSQDSPTDEHRALGLQRLAPA